jgi:dihydrodipicolinate synthase/N-acetylneuraminate lyase
MNRGVKNFFLFSSCGEGEFLSREAQFELISYARKELPNSIRFFVGCFSDSDDEILARAKFAEKNSCDIVVNLPFSALTNELSFMDFFEELFNQTSSGILLYNNPFLFKRNIPLTGLEKVAGWERILGVIDASRNSDYFSALLRHSNSFKPYLEPDDLFFEFSSLNAYGFAPLLSNVYPKFFLDSIANSTSRDYVSSIRKQADFSSFLREYFPVHSRIQSAKYLLSTKGIIQPFFHPSLGELGDKQKFKIEELVKSKELA